MPAAEFDDDNNSSREGKPGPLKGLRVLELGSLIAGPFACRILAEFGAEVIKIEPPNAGDPLRTWRYVDGRSDSSLWWALQSRNKKLITLDLSQSRGLEIGKRLAAEADVLVENFRPGTLEKLGLTWELLHELNPGLILVRVSGFGQTGPYRDRPGFANIGEAIGGLRFITGESGRPPVRTGISIGDSVASLHAVIGTLMALEARRGTGEGQVVDVALHEAVFNLMESMVPEYDVAGIVRTRTGAALPGIAPTNSYRTKDGRYVAIGANSDAIFRRIMSAIGRPELGDDPRYRTNAERSERAEELDRLIESWTSLRTLEEVVDRLETASVPVGPIYSVEDIVADEQYRSREMIVSGEIEGIGQVKMPGLAPKLSATPGKIRWYGGPQGQHNQEIYRGLLELSEEEYKQLANDHVI